MILDKIINFFVPKVERKLLGRWGLKTCEDLKSVINSTYQNRDHCGDMICKTPQRPETYIKQLKETSFKQIK